MFDPFPFLQEKGIPLPEVLLFLISAEVAYFGFVKWRVESFENKSTSNEGVSYWKILFFFVFTIIFPWLFTWAILKTGIAYSGLSEAEIRSHAYAVAIIAGVSTVLYWAIKWISNAADASVGPWLYDFVTKKYLRRIGVVMGLFCLAFALFLANADRFDPRGY